LNEVLKTVSLDDRELLERVESATSTIIEDIQINLLEGFEEALAQETE
jgi:hypothetical protein